MIAVLGANGFIGKHLTRALASSGRPVTAVARQLDDDVRGDFIQPVLCDLRDLEVVTDAVTGVSTVIQLMGSSTPAQGNNRAAENIRNDVIPHVEFLSRCVDVGVRRFVFMSSGGTIYGQVRGHEPVGEDAPTNPISSHGVTKLMVEQFIRLHSHLHGLEYVILRAANPFGPGQRFRQGQGLIPALLQRHAAGQPVTIFGDGSATRDYVYIDDLVDATIRSATMPGPQQQVLNIGTGIHRSVLEVVRTIERISGVKFKTEYAPRRETDVDSIALDITRVREVLGWSPSTDFVDGLTRTLDAMAPTVSAVEPRVDRALGATPMVGFPPVRLAIQATIQKTVAKGGVLMTEPEPTHFELGGMRFVADVRSGSKRGQSTEEEFVIVKTPPFIRFYESLRSRIPRSILEIGMFEGGSMVLLDRIFEPDRIVGVDIRQSIPALEKYRASRPQMRTYYGLSQDDPALDDVLHDEFPDGIDLIIDDASHQYEQTRKTFEIAFPHLKPGGLYVIEDWAWAHTQGQQEEDHPWYRRKALTNLVFELVVNLPRSAQLQSLDMRPELIAIEKAAGAAGPMDLGVGMRTLRGREIAEL